MHPPTVNLEQMAEALRISLPTMRKLLKRYDDFPVVQRGTNGVPWQFDKAAVITFILAKRAEEAAAGAAKDEHLAQITLPLEETQPGDDTVISWSDREKRVRALQREDELATSRKFLVQITDLRAALTECWPIIGQALQSQPGRLGRKHNLPDAVVRDMRAENSAIQRELHRKLTEKLGAFAPPPEDDEDDKAA